MCLCLKNINISVSYPNTILLQCADFPYVWALFFFSFFPSCCYVIDFKDPKGEGREEQKKKETGNNFRNLRDKWLRDSTLDSARPRS